MTGEATLNAGDIARLAPEAQEQPFTRVLDNGNVVWLFNARDPSTPNDNERVTLLGRAWILAGLLETEAALAEIDTQRAIYEFFYARLPASYIADESLPDPATLAGSTFADISLLNQNLALDWRMFLQAPGPSVRAPDWQNEEGAGLGGDSTRLVVSGSVVPYNTSAPASLAASAAYPLRGAVSHVRNQGARGTGVAFGISAAAEALIGLEASRSVNLCEQLLFNQMTRNWHPSACSDGGMVLSTLQSMHTTGFRYPYENAWNYNPSPFRVATAVPPGYAQSCWWKADATTAYPGLYCADTSHQSGVVCTTIDGLNYCATLDPGLQVPGGTGFGLENPVPLGVGTGANAVDVALAKAAVHLGHPVIITFTVPNGMRNVASSGADAGVVPWNPFDWLGDDNNRTMGGGHCALLVGFVENADLPAGMTAAVGEGYFILKNSWGQSWGDKGFAYVSDLWVETFMRGLYVAELAE